MAITKVEIRNKFDILIDETMHRLECTQWLDKDFTTLVGGWLGLTADEGRDKQRNALARCM